MISTGVSFGFNLIKRKHKLSKIRRKEKTFFINRIKYAEQKTFRIFIEVYQIHEGNDYDKLYEVLSTLKKKFKNKRNPN